MDAGMGHDQLRRGTVLPVYPRTDAPRLLLRPSFWSGWPDLNRRPLRPEANARCCLPPLLLCLTCPAPSVDILYPLMSVAVVTQLGTHPPRGAVAAVTGLLPSATDQPSDA
jgi:hypothetical protein